MRLSYANIRARIRTRIRVLEDTISKLDAIEAIENEPEPLTQLVHECGPGARHRRGGRRARLNPASAGSWADAIDALLVAVGKPMSTSDLVLALKAQGRAFPKSTDPYMSVYSVLYRCGARRGWVKVGREWSKVEQPALSSTSTPQSDHAR